MSGHSICRLISRSICQSDGFAPPHLRPGPVIDCTPDQTFVVRCAETTAIALVADRPLLMNGWER